MAAPLPARQELFPARQAPIPGTAVTPAAPTSGRATAFAATGGTIRSPPDSCQPLARGAPPATGTPSLTSDASGLAPTQ